MSCFGELFRHVGLLAAGGLGYPEVCCGAWSRAKLASD
jgi:hypothetical protein